MKDKDKELVLTCGCRVNNKGEIVFLCPLHTDYVDRRLRWEVKNLKEKHK